MVDVRQIPNFYESGRKKPWDPKLLNCDTDSDNTDDSDVDSDVDLEDKKDETKNKQKPKKEDLNKLCLCIYTHLWVSL
jgi:hypothetical protein